MKITTDDTIVDGLECPCCGYDYLHQERIEIFTREEDAPAGCHVIVEPNNTAHFDRSMRGNPSRRDAIKVRF
jgi:hypothetical protein